MLYIHTCYVTETLSIVSADIDECNDPGHTLTNCVNCTNLVNGSLCDMGVCTLIQEGQGAICDCADGYMLDTPGCVGKYMYKQACIPMFSDEYDDSLLLLVKPQGTDRYQVPPESVHRLIDPCKTHLLLPLCEITWLHVPFRTQHEWSDQDRSFGLICGFC